MKKGKVCIACEQALCGTRTGWNLVPYRTSLQVSVCKVIDTVVPWGNDLIDDKEIQKVERYHDVKKLAHLDLSQKIRYGYTNKEFK